MPLLTIRIDDEQASALRRLASTSGRSKSEIVREAVAVLARGSVGSKEPRPYDLIKHLIGIVRDGAPIDLSERTGEGFARLVREKARRRGR